MPSPETPSPCPGDDSGPESIRRNFIAVAAATDTPAPGDGSRLLTVPLSPVISTVARTVGSILHATPIFRQGESIVTVDESGKIEPMDPVRFTTWLEDYFLFTRPDTDSPKAQTIGKDKAAQILRSNQFRKHLRELKGVSEVRLPVWTGEGEARTVELAAEGFNPATGRYTVNTIPFADDMTLKDAETHLFECFGEFPYDPEGEEQVLRRRSFAVHMALTLGVFCNAMFPEKTARPVGAYLATQPGSGKSLLSRLALCAVYGLMGENDMPKEDKALQTLLESVALQRDPILVLDNCYTLRSSVLDRFVTSPKHNPRLFNLQQTRTIPNSTQCFVNGNNLTLSEDLARRTLRVDLFVPGETKGRKFKKRLTNSMLDEPSFRSKMLAALWALVRNWRDNGMPMMDDVFDSFEEWSAVIGGMVIDCGLMNPFTPPPVEYGGDEAGRALILVIARIVGEAALGVPPVLTPGEILDRAEADGMLETILPSAKAGGEKKSLGWKLKPLRGRHLIDSQGRSFEFGRRELGAGAGYAIRFL
jgi:hypothetical protein